MDSVLHRMAEDLALGNRSPGTIDKYLRACRKLAHFYKGRPLAKLSQEEVRAWLLHRKARGLEPSTLRVDHAAVTWLYRHTLGRPEVVEGIPRPRVLKKKPLVPTRQEVAAILGSARPFYQRMMMVAYGAGLRSSEICTLRVEDIDSRHGLLHVRHGKGDKARTVMLSPRLLEELRAHWRQFRPPGPWLFPKRVRGGGWVHAPVLSQALGDAFRGARKRAGIRRRVTLHGLRHAFATHLFEQGVAPATLQALLGHANPKTTAHYTAVQTRTLRTTPSPLDLLYNDRR